MTDMCMSMAVTVDMQECPALAVKTSVACCRPVGAAGAMARLRPPLAAPLSRCMRLLRSAKPSAGTTRIRLLAALSVLALQMCIQTRSICTCVNVVVHIRMQAVSSQRPPQKVYCM